MLLHVVGGDQVAADVADLLELLLLVAALVDQVDVLHVHLLLLEDLLAVVPAAHVVSPGIPYTEDFMRWVQGGLLRLVPEVVDRGECTYSY